MNFVFAGGAYSGPTRRFEVSGTALALTSVSGLSLTYPGDQRVVGCLITVESKDVRVAFGGISAVQGTAGGTGHIIESGQSLQLDDPGAVVNGTIIARTSTETSYVQITPQYAY
jgi:hypothetical protein